MIKISHVMTVYTIKLVLCMCITPFQTYTNIIIEIYDHAVCYICIASLIDKLSNLPAIHL
jgi:hypothetical protein